jgi:4-hydroxy-tetrahydrodipicolinate reductase
VGVAGASGRLGRAVVELLGETPGAALAARIGRDAASDPARLAAALDACDVVIDASTAAAATALAQACAARAASPALVIGATGFTDAEVAALEAASARVAILRTGNFSLGVNLLLGLVRLAAAALPAAEWDIEIAEAHHRRKVDAPSGTALMLGEAAARGRGGALRDLKAPPRDGIGAPRALGEIGFSVLRGGGIVGEHAVSFVAEDEILTLSHSARDRRLFARGAVAAALWTAGRPPGLYAMAQVLGLAPAPARTAP